MSEGIRWSVHDRDDNEIYLTEERWEHITEPSNHPEMLGYERELKETVRIGKRKQDALNPQKYRYSKTFERLAEENTQLVAIVLFRCREGEPGMPVPNNFIVTAYQKQTIKGL